MYLVGGGGRGQFKVRMNCCEGSGSLGKIPSTECWMGHRCQGSHPNLTEREKERGHFTKAAGSLSFIAFPEKPLLSSNHPCYDQGEVGTSWQAGYITML